MVSAHTHAPYICTINNRLVTSASSFGRVITEIKLTIDRRTNDVVSATADNNIVTQDVPKDAGATAIVNHYKTFADPIANQVVGSITAASLTRNATPAGESVLGDIIADAQLDATKPSDFGGSVVAFMNPGGIRSDLIYTRTDGAPQDVTYGNLFTVQPFGNTVTVKTCTSAQIDALLEQQVWPNPSAIPPVAGRILQVSEGFSYTWQASARTDRRSIRRRSRSTASR